MKTLPGYTGYAGPFPGSEFKWRTTAMQTETVTTEAPATAPEPKITVEPIKGDSPNKMIFVNGRAWAKTSAQHHSRYGVSYTFNQLIAGRSAREISYPRPGAERSNLASWRTMTPSVRSFSKTRSNVDYATGQTDNRPTEQRIIDKARELIAAGHLIDPDEAARKDEAQREVYRAQYAADIAERKAEFRAKAIEALGERASHDADLIARVIEAMEWAQSQ